VGIQQVEQLEVWREAHALALDVYKLAGRLPDRERYGLTPQMQRAAVSVPANIAEGFRRRGTADKVRFYNISEASLEELRYYFLLCRDLGYDIDHVEFSNRSDRIARMLQGLTTQSGDQFVKSRSVSPQTLPVSSPVLPAAFPVCCLPSTVCPFHRDGRLRAFGSPEVR